MDADTLAAARAAIERDRKTEAAMTSGGWTVEHSDYWERCTVYGVIGNDAVQVATLGDDVETDAVGIARARNRWPLYLALAEAVTRLVTPRGPYLPWWCTDGGCIGCGRDAELEGVAHAPGCPAAEVDAALAALAKDGAQ